MYRPETTSPCTRTTAGRPSGTAGFSETRACIHRPSTTTQLVPGFFVLRPRLVPALPNTPTTYPIPGLSSQPAWATLRTWVSTILRVHRRDEGDDGGFGGDPKVDLSRDGHHPRSRHAKRQPTRRVPRHDLLGERLQAPAGRHPRASEPRPEPIETPNAHRGHSSPNVFVLPIVWSGSGIRWALYVVETRAPSRRPPGLIRTPGTSTGCQASRAGSAK